jgi:hypothetical protein
MYFLVIYIIIVLRTYVPNNIERICLIMFFKQLDEKTKRQIKASMKRTCINFIKLNIEDLNRITALTAFSMWTSRYISLQNHRKYYNLIELDEDLYSDLVKQMNMIFQREVNKFDGKDLSEEAKAIKERERQNHRLKEASPKQLYYASYLMNMVRNRPLPKRKYTMAEIGALINLLKKQLKA